MPNPGEDTFRPANLRQTLFVHRFAGLGRHPEMAAAIAVQGAEQTVFRDDRSQSGHHRRRRFLLHQLRMVDLAGGIVEDEIRSCQRLS